MATSVETRAVPQRMTLAEFEAYPWRGDDKIELSRGEVRISPLPPGAHSWTVRNIFVPLATHVRDRGLGNVFGDATMHVLPGVPDTVRGPDVSFVRAGKISLPIPLRGMFRLAPDLAVEVLSPSESWADTQEKLDELFAGGTAMAWIVSPPRRRVDVVTPDGRRRTLRAGDMLDGAPILPEFTMPVADVFAGVAREP